MATSTIGSAVYPSDPVRVEAASATVDITKYRDTGSGGYGFMVFGRSWRGYDNASSLYMVTGIQNGLYTNCVQLVKETYGPAVAVSGNNVTITFSNSSGGIYSIFPLYCIV